MIKEVELGSVCQFENGDRGKNYPSRSAFIEEGIPFINAGNLDNYKIKKDGLNFISEDKYNLIRGGKLQHNDILFCLRGSLGKHALNSEGTKGAIASSLVILRVKESLDVNYLNNYLKSNKVKRLIEKSDNGSSQPNLSASNVKKFKILLPPLPQQKKIAAILDAADDYRQKTKALIVKYDELTQSLFLDMFGDPVINPKGWEKVKFQNCVDDIIGGISLGGEVRKMKDNELGVLKISAVTSGVFLSEEYKVVNVDPSIKGLIKPKQGDLLFSRANTREMVGAVAIVDKDYDNLFLPDKLWKLHLKNNLLKNYYVKFLLSHDGFRHNLRKVATGTSGSMLNISKVKLRNLIIPLPSIYLQTQFANRVQSIEAQKLQAQESLVKAEDLFNCLLQQAFKGELINW